MKTLKDFLSDKELENIQDTEILEASDLPDYFVEDRAPQIHKMPDPPMVLIMRRKNVREFPGGKRVALYYIDKLHKYITIPYLPTQWNAAVTHEETNIIDKLQTISEEQEPTQITFDDGSNINVKPKMANAMLELYNKLNIQNRLKFVESIKSSSNDFKEILDFALKNYN